MDFLNVSVHPQAEKLMEQFSGTWKIASNNGSVEAFAALEGLPVEMVQKMIGNSGTKGGLRKRISKITVDGKPGWEMMPLQNDSTVDDLSVKFVLGVPFEMENMAEDTIKTVYTHDGEHSIRKTITATGEFLQITSRAEGRSFTEVIKYKEFEYTTVWERTA